jgi:hypothetical protein
MGTYLVSFRSSEPRTLFCYVSVYKHLTPNGVKTESKSARLAPDSLEFN